MCNTQRVVIGMFNESRSSAFRQIVKNCKPQSRSGGVGEITGVSKRSGFNKVQACREDSYWRNNSASKEWGDTSFPGGVIDQLESRSNELHRLSSELKKSITQIKNALPKK